MPYQTLAMIVRLQVPRPYRFERVAVHNSSYHRNSNAEDYIKLLFLCEMKKYSGWFFVYFGGIPIRTVFFHPFAIRAFHRMVDLPCLPPTSDATKFRVHRTAGFRRPFRR